MSYDDDRPPQSCRLCGLQLVPEESHVCPPPMPYEQAQTMARVSLSSAIPLHPRTKARIILGLKRGRS